MRKVLVSTGYGAGWSTWVGRWVAMDETLVELKEQGVSVEELTKRDPRLEGEFLYGWDNVTIKEVEEGTKFRIDEYDGAEYIVHFNDEEYYTA